jgi:hypothetical protein
VVTIERDLQLIINTARMLEVTRKLSQFVPVENAKSDILLPCITPGGYYGLKIGANWDIF